MTLSFRLDDLRGAEVQDLLRAHLSTMAEHSPPESRHALDLSGLQAPDVTFWSVWDAEVLVGCGALKELDRRHGEIKSMHTAKARRGQGIAAFMLDYIMDEARQRGNSIQNTASPTAHPSPPTARTPTAPSWPMNSRPSPPTRDRIPCANWAHSSKTVQSQWSGHTTTT